MNQEKLSSPDGNKLNDITIDIEAIRNVENHSITNGETIRQIALYGIRTRDNSLYCKIKKGYEWFGLYPEALTKLKSITHLPKKIIESEPTKEQLASMKKANDLINKYVKKYSHKK